MGLHSMSDENTFEKNLIFEPDEKFYVNKEDCDNELDMLKFKNSKILQSLDNIFKTITHPFID